MILRSNRYDAVPPSDKIIFFRHDFFRRGDFTQQLHPEWLAGWYARQEPRPRVGIFFRNAAPENDALLPKQARLSVMNQILAALSVGIPIAACIIDVETLVFMNSDSDREAPQRILVTRRIRGAWLDAEPKLGLDVLWPAYSPEQDEAGYLRFAGVFPPEPTQWLRSVEVSVPSTTPREENEYNDDVNAISRHAAIWPCCSEDVPDIALRAALYSPDPTLVLARRPRGHWKRFHLEQRGVRLLERYGEELRPLAV